MKEDLRKKLQIKDDMRVAVINAPLEFPPDEEQVIQDGTNAIIQFACFLEEIDSEILFKKKDKVVWIAFPKKTTGTPTDLGREASWTLFQDQGWVPVRQISIDKNWSAVRFRPISEIKELKRNTDYPGIDRVKKTVQVPSEFMDAMKAVGVVDKFESLSFTNRKEFVISILDAKKPETRQRRIKKNVETMLSL